MLDPLAPEAKRANVPLGWASPAFDVLQLEDYDWVTSGNHGATRRAVSAMDQRLGYPVAEQHYFSGFVLRSEEKAQWREIEFAAAESQRRGVAHTYVWALPQVARDGFTHFEIRNEDHDMQAFADVTFPIEIGREAEVIAEFSTNVVTTLSGHERRTAVGRTPGCGMMSGPGFVPSQSLALSSISFARGGGRPSGFGSPIHSISLPMQ